MALSGFQELFIRVQCLDTISFMLRPL